MERTHCQINYNFIGDHKGLVTKMEMETICTRESRSPSLIPEAEKDKLAINILEAFTSVCKRIASVPCP